MILFLITTHQTINFILLQNTNSVAMKKVLFIGILFFTSFTLFAQSEDAERIYKPFRVDVAIGYVVPSGSGIKTGGLFAIEPKYSVLPQLSVGFRLEGAGTGNSGTIVAPNVTAKVGFIGSYLVTSDYFFTNSDLRPFAGLGLGAFNFANFSVNINTSTNPVNESLAGGVRFGGMVRSGIEYRHFRFGLEYNMVGNVTIPPSSATANNSYTVKNSYFSIKVGFTFGGGKL